MFKLICKSCSWRSPILDAKILSTLDEKLILIWSQMAQILKNFGMATAKTKQEGTFFVYKLLQPKNLMKDLHLQERFGGF